MTRRAGSIRALAGRSLGALVAALAVASALPAAAQPIPTGRADVLLRRDCRSAIARQEVTLFGNGTVRLRSGPRGEERMALVEVTRDEVESLVAAIRAEDLGEAGAGSAGPEGEWIERCLLELPVLGEAADGGGPPAGGDAPAGDDAAAGGAAAGNDAPAGGEAPIRGAAPAGEAAPHDRSGTAGARRPEEPLGRRPDEPLGPGRPSGDHPATRFVYGHLDSLSLPLSRVVALVDELAVRAAAGAAAGALPAGYRPRQGDVVRRADGVLFRVVRATAALDGMPGGWELQGVVQPLALYVLEAELPREFVELVSRDEAHAP